MNRRMWTSDVDQSGSIEGHENFENCVVVQTMAYMKSFDQAHGVETRLCRDPGPWKNQNNPMVHVKGPKTVHKDSVQIQYKTAHHWGLSDQFRGLWAHCRSMP